MVQQNKLVAKETQYNPGQLAGKGQKGTQVAERNL